MKITELIEIVNDRFEYRDGGLYVKYRFHSRAQVGKRAGSDKGDGYRQIRIHKTNYSEHRLIWLLHKGVWPNGEIDHINHDKQDNRIENLRDVPRSINQQNQINARVNNKLGVSGVHWCKNAKKYRASIWAKGKKIHIGYFDTIELASAAHAEAKNKHHAEAVCPALRSGRNNNE